MDREERYDWEDDMWEDDDADKDRFYGTDSPDPYIPETQEELFYDRHGQTWFPEEIAALTDTEKSRLGLRPL